MSDSNDIDLKPIPEPQFDDLTIEEARKRDAMALAELIYDIYRDEKHSD